MGLIGHGGGAAGAVLTRRLALRAVFTVGVIAGTVGALAPVLGRRPGARTDRVTAPDREHGPALERFAEMYRGRHIQGTATVMVPAGESPGRRAARTASAAAVPSVEVRIDGRPLHVMRRADGSYLSLVNHYESFPTLLDVARAAVDELGDAQLSMTPLHSV
ncbi:tyrosinase family oxidase copper chaperone [Streptomyces sp. NPDC051907]|uniref:tyrosinase family oxidase copper chaperone n=1 Tax=Streptomyces sp. NPDC051907 TaxID=3155284 RepID=UPI0034405AB6